MSPVVTDWPSELSASNAETIIDKVMVSVGIPIHDAPGLAGSYEKSFPEQRANSFGPTKARPWTLPLASTGSFPNEIQPLSAGLLAFSCQTQMPVPAEVA